LSLLLIVFQYVHRLITTLVRSAYVSHSIKKLLIYLLT